MTMKPTPKKSQTNANPILNKPHANRHSTPHRFCTNGQFFYPILNKQDTNPEQKSGQHQINASRETNFWQTVSQT
jgi:hypothetical protein